METLTTRRAMRQRRKLRRTRIGAVIAAAVITGTLAFAGASAAQANETPVGDEGASELTVEVTEIAPEEDAPAQPDVTDTVDTTTAVQEQSRTIQTQSDYTTPPFDWNWQYAAPTCDGLTVVYPENIPAGSNNKDVNIRVKNLTTGETRTFNFHDSDFITSGKTVTYNVTQHPSWPGWTYYEVQWTQVHGTNYHWEGSVTCGTSPPTTPPCIQKPTWSYIFDGVGSGTVTVTAKDAKEGDLLCDPLALRATTYKYDLPASGKPSWPQTPVGWNDVLVDSIGTFSYAAPALEKCRQHDIYAQFVSKGGFDALAIPDKLYGNGQPFEPPFLHETLRGKGPNPTYNATTSDGCNTPPQAPEPKVEYTQWEDQKWVCGDTEVTQTRTKTVTPYKVVLQDGEWVEVVDTENIVVTIEPGSRPLTEAEIESCKPEIPESKVEQTKWEDQEWTCEDTKVTQTRTVTTTPFKAVLVGGSTWEIVEDTENIRTETETRTRPLTEEEIQSCQPIVIVPNPPQFVDVCGTENDEVQTPSDTDEWTYTTTRDGNIVVVTATAIDGVVNEAGTQITTWTHEFSDEACPTQTPTPTPPTPTATPTTPPVTTNMLPPTGVNGALMGGLIAGAIALVSLGVFLFRRGRATA